MLQETEAKQAHSLNFQEGAIKALVRKSTALLLRVLIGCLLCLNQHEREAHGTYAWPACRGIAVLAARWATR